jgi:hypothetical protein
MPYLRQPLKALPVKLAELGENAALIGAASMFDSTPGQRH